MASPRTIQVEFGYLKDLIGAGWDGAASARREAKSPPPSRAKAPQLAAASIAGAALGMLGAGLIAGRRRRSAMTVGGVIGTAVGLGAPLAWASRAVAVAAARNMKRRINYVRDARWLALHPIDYA